MVAARSKKGLYVAPRVQAQKSLLNIVQRGVEIFDLSRPYEKGMPQSPNHPIYTHTLPRRHGDMVRPDGGSAANDLISFGTHVGTHIDALAHVSQSGRLYGGLDANAEQVGGLFMSGGVHEIPPMVTRGIVLDVPGALEWESCLAGYEITVEDLEKTVTQQRIEIRAGDVVLIRSGWGRRWEEGTSYVGSETGVPGISVAGAEWLASKKIKAAGADTIAFEYLAPGAGHSQLPAHRVLLVESGINIIETLNLEDIAKAKHYEFTLILAPLHLVGATGAPVRPLAIVEKD